MLILSSIQTRCGERKVVVFLMTNLLWVLMKMFQRLNLFTADQKYLIGGESYRA